MDACLKMGIQLRYFETKQKYYGESGGIVVTNGTVERDGTRRRYGLTVPTTCTTPLEAVAWSYGMTTDEYQMIEVRT